MTEDEFKSHVTKATSEVHAMDSIDGFQDRELRTILVALEAGLRNPETNAAWDAYVMLAERVARGDA
jgi:hypothetical protein